MILSKNKRKKGFNIYDVDLFVGMWFKMSVYNFLTYHCLLLEKKVLKKRENGMKNRNFMIVWR